MHTSIEPRPLGARPTGRAARNPLSRRAVRFTGLLLVVYVAKQIIVALVSPPFTGHDEVAHFAAIRIVATEHRLPTLWADTLPVDLYRYHAFALDWEDPSPAILYTAVHPPLYYLVMAPLYRAAGGLSPEAAQYVLRLAAIPFGAVIVLFAALLAGALYPDDGFMRVTVPAVVAFQPQVSYEAAMVNNDVLATALFSIVVYLLVLVVRDGATMRRAAVLGAVVGLALLAKATAVIALVLIPAALWLGRRRAPWSTVAKQTAAAVGVALLFVGPWWWFMTRTYGDPFAVRALASLQPDLTRDDATFLQLVFSGRFLIDRWSETWGDFGWKLIHIRPSLTVWLGLLAAVALAGLVSLIVRDDRSGAGTMAWRRVALAILAAACVLGYAGTAQFGTRFVLTQARYFFPIVNAAAILFMLGLRAWIPVRWRTVAQALVVFVAIAVDVVIYTTYVVPFWTFR